MVNNQENLQLRQKSHGVHRKGRYHCRLQEISPGLVFVHRLGLGHGLAEVAGGVKFLEPVACKCTCQPRSVEFFQHVHAFISYCVGNLVRS